MKKITLSTILMVGALSFGQNLVQNGDFETGETLTGWNQGVGGAGSSYNTDAIAAGFSVGDPPTYTLEGPHGGTYAGRMKSGDAALRYVFNVEEGSTYVVQFWFTNQFAFPDLICRVWNYTGDTLGSLLVLTPIVADSGKNASLNTDYGCNNTDNSGLIVSWKEAKFSFTVPSGMTKARFQYASFSTTDGFQLIDDVSISKVPDLSTDDLSKFNFSSYPNPAKDRLNLSAAKSIDKIEIYNLLGQQVIVKALNSSKSEVNVANLSKGIYVARVFIEDAVGSYKFIKD